VANEILIHTENTVVCWADETDYDNTNSGLTRTHQLDLTSLADGAARQAAKADLGARRAQGYSVKAAVSFASAPTAGNAVEFYWSSSPSATAAIGNAGGYAADGSAYVTGADAAFAPAGGAEADIDEYKQHLTFVGVLGAGADAGNTQVSVINSYFSPAERYGQFVIKNDSGQAFAANASGVYVALVPVTDELQ